MNDTSSILTKLHKIATALSSRITEEPLCKVFQHISPEVIALLEVEHSTIALLDEGRRFLRVEAEYPKLSIQLTGERIPIQDRATQFALLESQQPVVANDLSNHPLTSESSSFRRIAESLDIKSMLIVPMLSDGKTIGTISVETVGRTKRFSNEEVDLCLMIANQIAAFVQILRLREEQHKYQRQTNLIAPATTRTNLSARGTAVAHMLFSEVRKVIQFKKASLQLIDEGRRILVGAFGFDEVRSNPWHLRPIETDYLINEIVSSKKTKIIPNTVGATGWEKQADTADVNSWIGVPAVFEGEVTGLLTLDYDQPGFYAGTSEDVLVKLQELTALATREIQTLRVIEAGQHQLTALDIIRDFAEKVAIKLVPSDLLKAIALAISQGLQCTRCSVFVLEHAEGRSALVFRAVCQEASCDIVPAQVLPDPDPAQLPSPVDYVFQSGETIAIDDREHGSRFDFTHDAYQGARSMLIVPLRIGDRNVGVVCAVDKSPTWFSGADRLLLETLARQAASAIERDFGLELVHSIGNKILGATEVDTVLKDVVFGAMKLTRADSGVIYELDKDCTEVIRSCKPEGSVHPKPRLDDPKGITRKVIAGKAILAIPDIDEHDFVNPELRGRYRSMFAVPLLLGDDAVGVLYLNCKNVRSLTETERSLLDTLAGQAALAIQRTRLYEQIRDSDAMYRSLVDHIPQSVFQKDKKSLFTGANTSFCQSLGKSLGEIKGKSDFDFYQKDDAEKYIRGDIEVMAGKKPVSFDEEHQPPGKPKVLVRVVKTPVLDADGNVIGVQAIFWEITKEVEEREMTQRWRSLAEQSPDGIVVHEGGKITLANPAAVRLFGVTSPAELEGRSILEFVDERSRPLARTRLERLAKGDDVEPMVEMCVLRKPDEKVDVEVYTRRVQDTGETQVVFHDLARTKRLLREMHHRGRRSLNQVDGFLTRQERFTNDPDVLHAFKTLRERIQAMALVHTILYKTGRESDVEMQLYLNELREPLLRAHDFCKDVSVSFSAPGVVLNEKQATFCGLIVTELVSNSLLHAFPPCVSEAVCARISVEITMDEGVVKLIVADNGVGMKKDSVIEDSMGMSLVRSLVSHDLGGRMTTNTEGGTCFIMEFRSIDKRKDRHYGE